MKNPKNIATIKTMLQPLSKNEKGYLIGGVLKIGYRIINTKIDLEDAVNKGCTNKEDCRDTDNHKCTNKSVCYLA